MSEKQAGAENVSNVPYRRLRTSQVLPALLEMQKPPECLHVWGTLPPSPRVSIVGTRRPSTAGWWSAFRLAAQLASSGVTVVSGGALGIDAAAHQGALSVGGATLVVGPTWFEEAYPKQHRELFGRIVDSGGGYLSVADPGTPALNPAFFFRNEALVALSEAVVLGECPLRSGARNAMAHARRLGRRRYVLPFFFDEPNAYGSWDEINGFGGRLLGRSDPLLKFLMQLGSFDNPAWWEFGERQREDERARTPPRRRREVGSRGKKEDQMNPEVSSGTSHALGALDAVERKVIAALLTGATNADEICDATELDVPVVAHQLAILTLQGRVAKDSGGLLRYQPEQHHG